MGSVGAAGHDAHTDTDSDPDSDSDAYPNTYADSNADPDTNAGGLPPRWPGVAGAKRFLLRRI
jgi:hypothetical protein